MNAFGIDLGSSNIKIYNASDDTYFMEKNMIAIKGRDSLFAYGDSAFDMYEKAPEGISVSYPVVNGVIADINNMNTLIHYFVSDLTKGGIRPADYYIAVPTDVTEVERRAFLDLIRDSNVKPRRIFVVEKALADGITDFIDTCTMMQYYNFPLVMVDGPSENIKITTPEDFYIMRAILEERENAQIYGE